MVKLFVLKPDSQIIDMFTRNGTTTSAAYLNNYQNVLSYYSNQNEIYWIKIQQILGANKEKELRFEPGLFRGELDVLTKQLADGVLLAPPFNLKFDFFQNSHLSSKGIKDSNSLYIETAYNALKIGGKIVAIVMDGFLLSSLYSKTRSYLKEVGTIEAIISLPSDTFRPYSAVKTSLIVIKKNPSNNYNKTFFASLEEVPKENLINCRQDKNIDSILTNYELFISNNEFPITKFGFVINDVSTENFHFSKYWFQSQNGDKAMLNSGFIAIPLKELIVDISRGSAIINDNDNGDIPFIGPASIRSLLIKKEGLSYTSTSKLPKGTIKRAENDDIIINIIGPYRGRAALVTSEVIGFPINRHLISIKANLNLIIPGYLVVALNSKYVQEQFLDKSSGTVIQALNLASFEEIYLPVPNLEEQEKIYSEYSKLLDELSKLQSRESEIQSELNNRLNKLGKGGGSA